MTTEQQTPNEKPDVAKWVVMGFIAGIIMTALALEYYGFIYHPSDEEALVVEEFKLLSLETDRDLKISPKVSGKIALCVDGFLLLRPDNGKEVAGILVDRRNRPIECQVDINRRYEE